ncbi:MAG: hypothetical protein AAF830_10490 [Pseudomonadota bacterium]
MAGSARELLETRQSCLLAVSASSFVPWLLAQPPERLFVRWGLFPGVTGARSEASWDRVGASRELSFDDRTSLTETIETLGGNSLSYAVSRFEGPFGKLVDSASARWDASETARNSCEAVWTYSFAPRSVLGRPVLAPLLVAFQTGFMRQAMNRIANALRDSDAK